jgi:hypothetical protein
MVLALVAAAAPLPACASPDGAAVAGAVPAVDSTLAALYASGQDYGTFLAEAKARRELWVTHTERAVVPADVLETTRALMGKWRILVVAVDSCSDSANTIPYLAKLVALVPSLEMRIVQPGPGKPVMEAHRTPDGRAATPTVVILDPAGKEVGCWVERPSSLQRLAVEARAAGTLDAFARDKQKWYDADAGLSTIREVAAVLAAAAAGSPRCDAPR